MAGPKEQPIPPDAITNENAVEVLRAFVVDGGLSISFTRAFEDPGAWGMMLADIARHAARVFDKEGAMSEAEAMQRIVDMFEAELGSPTDLGETSDRKDWEH